MADLEEQKKLVLPYMQRAQEIQQADPKVAYYCRLHALEEAMKLPQRHKDINALLVATMNQLEKDKQRLTLDSQEDRHHIEGFALKIFINADKVDRAGRATENTAKAYYAASIFLDVLNHFGEMDADLVEKQRYAVWRAAEIRKAIREGRTPTPPPQPEDTLDMGGLDLQAGPSQSSATAPPDMSGLSISASYTAPAAPVMLDQAAPASTSFSYPSFTSAASSTSGAGAPPMMQQPPPPPALAPAPTQTQASPGFSYRFKPGSKVLYCPPTSSSAEQGTVGQVMTGPTGAPRYRVALRDRLVEAEEGDVAADVTEGQHVTFMGLDGPVPSTVVIVNNMSWPPSYLLKPEGGKELAAEYLLVSLLSMEDHAALAAMPPPPPAPAVIEPPALPPVPHGTRQAPDHSSYGGFDMDSISGAHASAPPPPPFAPPPAAPSYPSHPTQPSAPPPPPPPSSSAHDTARPAYQAPPPPTPSAPAAVPYHQPPQPAAQPAASYMVAAPLTKPPLQAIQEAQKKARYAVSALSFEDVATAVDNLQQALRLLTQQR